MADPSPISNPVLSPEEGVYEKVAANPMAAFIIRLWRAVMIVGGLTLLLFLVWGAIDWLMSEGDPENLKSAKKKMIHAVLGMGILAASYAIVTLFKAIFGFDILKLEWPTPE